MKITLIISLLINAILVTAKSIEIYIAEKYRSSLMTYYDGDSFKSIGVVKSVCNLEYKGVDGYGYVIALNDTQLYVSGHNELRPLAIGQKVKFTFTISDINGIKSGKYEIYEIN